MSDDCNGIVQHWNAHWQEVTAAKGEWGTNAARPSSTPIAATPMQSPAATLTTFDANPSGADIEIDGNYVGSTPSTISAASAAVRSAFL